jgi:NAD(P)-dependent dehydrogenase (short-subunit alcohol dehydrogenase family)
MTFVYATIDVSVDACVSKLREALSRLSFDIIINNAGLMLFKEDILAELDIDKITEQFQVNAAGPLRVTKALEGTLKQGSKIIIITSRFGSIEDNTSGGYYGYRMSKAAVNMACKSLSLDLKHKGSLTHMDACTALFTSTAVCMVYTHVSCRSW